MEDDLFLKRFGKHVRKLRTEKGLSLREVELNNDVNRSWLSDIENGKLNFRFLNLKKIADCLDVELEELFKGFKK